MAVFYWRFRASHVTVRFRNESSLDLSRVTVSYRCGMQTGTDSVQHVLSGRSAALTFPSSGMASYSFVVTFSDGTTFTADERLAFGGYHATESVSRSQSIYTADLFSSLFHE